MSLEIDFSSTALYGERQNNPKAIARAFGADGWKRDTESGVCWQINWVKKVGEIKVTIRGAEFLKPNLTPEVKL